jgi:alpha-L-rhamnosidase
VDDVGSLLQKGTNVVAIRLADGRYDEVPKWSQIYESYGTELGVLFQLEVETSDGKRLTLTSDGSWKYGSGGYLKASYWIGECHDPSREPSGMGTAGFDDSKWKAVTVLDEWPT